MNTFPSRIALLLALVVAVGAGCLTTSPAPSPSPTGTVKPVGIMAFGKLPAFTVNSGTKAATPEVAGQNVATAASSAPSAGVMMGGATTAPAGMGVGRPIPSPFPNPNPATVQYNINAALPTWGTNGDVLQVKHSIPQTDGISSLTNALGVPSQLFPSGTVVNGINLQWIDPDKNHWTFDATNNSLSFWKNIPTRTIDQNAQPSYTKDEMVKIADAFFDAHGFSSIRSLGGDLEEQARIWIMNQAGASTRPCPVIEKSVPPMMGVVSGSGSAGSAVAVPTIAPAPNQPSSIAMPPCGWWPQQVTVVYQAKRDNRSVVDTGGYPSNAATVTIDLTTKNVTSAYFQLDQQTDSSSYPLIDQETAKKRLASGGTNPVWPWGDGGNITVNITSVNLAWMRYDTWQEDGNQTFLIPALVATGTVDRHQTGATTEVFRTMVPLLTDDAFTSSGTAPQPIPLTNTVK